VIAPAKRPQRFNVLGVTKLRVVGDTIVMHDGRRMIVLGAQNAEWFAKVALRQAARLRAEGAV